MNCFIVNQSCIDLLVGITAIFLQYYKATADVPDGIPRKLYCRLWMSTYIIWSLTVASGYNLTFLTIERFLAITKPMSYSIERVQQRLPFVLALAWFAGIMLASVNLFLFYVNDGQCHLIAETDPPILEHFVPIYSFISYCIIPTIVMSATNVKMGITLRYVINTSTNTCHINVMS